MNLENRIKLAKKMPFGGKSHAFEIKFGGLCNNGVRNKRKDKFTKLRLLRFPSKTY
jgi:hypothetical protein